MTIYWYQLEGLSVISHHEGEQIGLAGLSRFSKPAPTTCWLFKGDAESIDREERLIPYVDQFVTSM